MYDVQKEKLLLRTTVSEQKRLQTLLTTVELGDRTRSQLLHEMQRRHKHRPRNYS